MSIAWSFSSLESFEQCPYRYCKVRVEKSVQDPPGPEAQWGTRVHKVLEDRVKTGQPIAGPLAMYEPYAAKFMPLAGTPGFEAAQQRTSAERKIALTENLTPCGWFDKSVWVRCVIDISVDLGERVVLGDWKTGKRKPSAQLELTAAIGASVYPAAERFDTAFFWLKEKAVDTASYKRSDTGEIWSRFVPRVRRIEKAMESGQFEKRPSGLCRKYCPVKTCEFYGG